MAFERKIPPLTFWTIAWAVCIGILLASVIETVTAGVTLYLTMKFEIDPAVKKLFAPKHYVSRAKL